VKKHKTLFCVMCGDEFTEDALKELKEWGEGFYKDEEIMICPDCYDNYMHKDPEDQLLDMMHYDFHVNSK